VRHDWKHSRKQPLSDEAVRADLEGRGLDEVRQLALGESRALTGCQG
jgi:hypothetical protein